MDKKSKVLIVSFLLILLVSSVWKFKVYVLDRDFVINDQIPCDTEMELCFVHICDTENECDTEPYKKISIRAIEVPVCDKYREDKCPIPSCSADSINCRVFFCSDDAVESGEECYQNQYGSNSEATTIDAVKIIR